jgi:putative aminopeptidase FrvX
MYNNVLDESFLLNTLTELLAIPSPTGYTDGVVHYMANKLQDMRIDYELTRRGAIWATILGKISSPD